MKIWIDGALDGSITSACVLEDEIERRGLQEKYVTILLALIDPDPYTTNEYWAILRATPEQRAQAFLEAIK